MYGLECALSTNSYLVRGVRINIVISMFVCLSVSPLAYLKNHVTEIRVRGSVLSDGVLIRYVLPVLWITHVFTQWALWCIVCFLKRPERNSQNTASVPTKLCSTLKVSKHTSWIESVCLT